jgi:hypothetical protein
MSQVSYLLKAIRSGFLMAGLMTCGCGSRSLQDAGAVSDTASSSDVAMVSDTGSSSDVGMVSDARSSADVVSNPPVLPRDRETSCPGPHYGDGGGYTGSCCEHVVCRAPVDGGCPQGNDGRFYGSGSCLCKAIEGPYTIADDDPRFAAERQQGPCCYISTYVTCVGRPLVIAEGMRVAPVVGRGDWC